MVNPDDLLPSDERDVLENHEFGSLRQEAFDGTVKNRLFQPNAVERKQEEVYLPILIIPGVASSGLYVEKSSLDKSYEGLRIWMNPAFLARARLQNKIFNEDEIKEADERKEEEEGERRIDNWATTEDELYIQNAWIHHIGLDRNMIDEKEGNRVRAYEGLFGCEYLVDNPLAKSEGWVMAPMVDYCIKVMGYEREKSIDAMPYDWRLAPSVNEKRDGYLTKMIQRIERMYLENGNLPIVLVCHSMGAKMGHYFLNFAKKQRGQEWLDKYVHTYMPLGAPHGGVGCAVRTGITGQGLDAMVDALVGNVADGLMMYRSWSCGNWLMPRILPKDVFPTCILRREGELGVTLASQIEVGSLFENRSKPPKELRLTVIFRDICAHSDYHPVRVNGKSMKISFDETFYIAVPDLGDEDELGKLVLYLEEPAGGIIGHYESKFMNIWRNATSWARYIKKKVSKFVRGVTKKWGTVIRVGVCEKPLKLRVSDFEKVGTEDTRHGMYTMETFTPLVRCKRGNPTNLSAEPNSTGSTTRVNRRRMSLRMSLKRAEIGTVALKLSYNPAPKPSSTKPSKTPMAMINEDTPQPPIMSNTIHFDKIKYDVMNATDVFKADGFVDNMFELVENVYEGDPLGPTKESSIDAPPVNCVRSIYGINVNTEAGAIYKKVPVVTVGDNKADCRYMLDKSANFRPTFAGLDSWAKLNLLTYKIKGGIVYETPRTLQNIPGQTSQKRVCGDGTVPYWNMVHALTWTDEVNVLTVDELEGASHRGVVADKRFFALLKRYCKVVDPRANAMMIMKNHVVKAGGGINALNTSTLQASSLMIQQNSPVAEESSPIAEENSC